MGWDDSSGVPREDWMERRGSRSAGYVIVVLGVMAFVVGCFLPYWDLPSGMRPLNYNTSYFRLIFGVGAGVAANVGGFLLLFGGPAALAWIAIAGIHGSWWTRPALSAATVVWSLTWIGVLLGVSRLAVDDARRVGWWVLLLGVGVVVIGTILIWISDRQADAPAHHPEE
jgi:hypothetical protein